MPKVISKADINKIVDKAISEALEEQADKALCKAYCEYLQERLADNSKWTDAMIYKLQEQAQTEEQLRELSRIKGIQASLYKWVKCIIIEQHI